jgi:hypothetical protein
MQLGDITNMEEIENILTESFATLALEDPDAFKANDS